MAPPTRDTAPVTHRLGHDNRTIYAADSNNPHSAYQVVLSNREVKIPGKILVFRKRGESDADAIARHIKEGERTPEMAIDYNHRAVDLVGASVVVNAPGNVGHAPYNARSNSHMDHAVGTHYNNPAVSSNFRDGVLIGSDVVCQHCGPSREVFTRSNNQRRSDSSYRVPGEYQVLRSNGHQYQRHDEMQGVEYLSNNQAHRPQALDGYHVIAPKQSNVEHSRSFNAMASSPYGDDSRQGRQEYLYPQAAHNQPYTGHVNTGFGQAAPYVPALRGGGRGSESENSQYPSDFSRGHYDGHHTASPFPGASPYIGPIDDLSGPPQEMQRYPVRSRSPFRAHANDRQGVDFDAQQRYINHSIRRPYHHQSERDAQMTSHAVQSGGSKSRQNVLNGTHHSSPASSQSSQQTRPPGHSPHDKEAPGFQFNAEQHHATNAARLDSLPSSVPDFPPKELSPSKIPPGVRHSLLNLDADGYEIWRGPGINPRVFIRPDRPVPHTEEPISSPTSLSAIRDVENDGMPYYWEPLDRPGGPGRPNTVIGDPEHRVGWNGCKAATGGYLQPNPMSGPDPSSKLGSLPGMEGGDAKGYKLHSASAFKAPHYAWDLSRWRPLPPQ